MCPRVHLGLRGTGSGLCHSFCGVYLSVRTNGTAICGHHLAALHNEILNNDNCRSIYLRLDARDQYTWVPRSISTGSVFHSLMEESRIGGKAASSMLRANTFMYSTARPGDKGESLGWLTRIMPRRFVLSVHALPQSVLA